MPDVWQDTDGKWYHRDETDNAVGPFDTEAEACEALKKYVRWLETGSNA